MDLEKYMAEKAKRAREASYALLGAATAEKDKALSFIAEEIEKNRDIIKKENAKDLETAKKKKRKDAFIDRLTLTDKRIDTMIKNCADIKGLKDPVGEVTREWTRPNGLKITKKRMPLGVVGIIFEARPNVCVEASALTLKSGNAVILRGGSDAVNSNICLGNIIRDGIKKAGLPESAVEVIEETDRETILHLVKAKEFVDVIIPRGGVELIRFIEENSVIPVIRHDAGICHVYADKEADIHMAVNIAFNSKVQRPGVCNAAETLLVHKDIAGEFMPEMAEKFAGAGVEMRVDKDIKEIIKNAKGNIRAVNEDDFKKEHLALVISVKKVNSLEEAVAHINKYGSHHTDSIVTENRETAEKFLTLVDSADCFHNCSTRFSDGYEYGLGAEMGISNQKLHVRGPMALEGLTSEKFVVYGAGQIRE